MKYTKHLIYTMLFAMVTSACDQEVITLQEPTPPNPPAPMCEGATAGSVNFTKFVAVGNSFVAGVQGGALFTTGQNNSLAAILNKQFECVGAPAAFKQPDIKATLGWNLFITQPFLADNSKPILGRMLLQYGASTSPRPTPQAYPVGNIEALPNPQANPNFVYTGTKASLNNFAIPAITVGQALTPAAGNWADPDPAKGFTPFYGRLNVAGPFSSTIISDVDAAGGTFALVWLGLDDFFLHAAFGGDPAKAPLTATSDFQTRFGAVFAHPSIGLLTVNPNLKIVVGNFPNIFAMPHFTSVPWNAIVFTAADQATKIDPINGGYAPYNGGLDAAFNGGAITAAERDKRKIHFAVGANGVVIEDESLTNLSGMGIPSYRHATATDIFPLAAGSVIGTEATPGNPTTTWGVSKPLTDQYALVPTEIAAIEAARTAFNGIVTGTAAAFSANIAVADVNAALNTFVTNKVAIINGVTLTPNINPPTGIYSEDGVHPNTRGYAFLSRVFIEAINAKFGSTIPLTNVGQYQATGLPIP